jgi:hypothetical protein
MRTILVSESERDVGCITHTICLHVAGRNLWASILAHGFIDTFGVIDAFFGWSN